MGDILFILIEILYDLCYNTFDWFTLVLVRNNIFERKLFL